MLDAVQSPDENWSKKLIDDVASSIEECREITLIFEIKQVYTEIIKTNYYKQFLRADNRGLKYLGSILSYIAKKFKQRGIRARLKKIQMENIALDSVEKFRESQRIHDIDDNDIRLLLAAKKKDVPLVTLDEDLYNECILHNVDVREPRDAIKMLRSWETAP